jgi:hypothetical protein
MPRFGQIAEQTIQGFVVSSLLGITVICGCQRTSDVSSPRAAPSSVESDEAVVAGDPSSGAIPADPLAEWVPSSPPGSSGESAAAADEPAQPAPVNRPPRADRTPTRPGDATKITFDDLNLQMPANVVFRPFMVTPRVEELEGQRVSISGYMHGGAAGSSGIKKFVLLKNTECKFGKDGQADHLAMVILKNGVTASYTRSDIKVEGTLRIEPFTGEDGNTWSIYNLEEAQIR